MAQLDSTEFKIQTQTLFPTNGVGQITAADLRTQLDNVADSAVFVITGQAAAPTANDDDANTAGNGVFQPGHIWVDETNDAAYVCLNNSTGAAVWTEITQSGGGSSPTFPAVENETVLLGYDFVAADAGKYKRLSASGAETVTITGATFAAGDEIYVEQSGAGTLTFTAGVDMTIQSRGNVVDTAGQYAVVMIKFITPSLVTLSGDLV